MAKLSSRHDYLTESEKEECQKIMDAIVDMWQRKILEVMAIEPYPDWDDAFEEVKKEMLK